MEPPVLHCEASTSGHVGQQPYCPAVAPTRFHQRDDRRAAAPRAALHPRRRRRRNTTRPRRAAGVGAATDQRESRGQLAPIAGTLDQPAFAIFTDCYHRATLVRPAGDVLVIAPYIVECEHINKLVNTLTDSISGYA
jgi:hypothetical protein